MEDAVRAEMFISENFSESQADDSTIDPLILSLMDISQYHVVAADFGGPVAYVPRNTDERPDDAAIIFLTATGKPLGQHVNEDLLMADESVVFCGWTQRQTLVILLANAEAFFYHGPMDRNPTAWPLAMLQAGDSVSFGCIGLHESMLAFVTADLNLFVSKNLDSDEPIGVAYEELRFLDSTRPPSCMVVLGQHTKNADVASLPGRQNRSSKPRVVLPCIGMGLVVVESSGVTQTYTTDKWSNSTVVAMSVHTNINTICVCTEDLLASVHLLDSNFTELMSVPVDEFVGGYGQQPVQLAWLPRDVRLASLSTLDSDDNDDDDSDSGEISNGYLVLSFREPPWAPAGWGVLIVSPSGDSMVRDYDCEQIHLVQEVDGVRVVVLASDGSPSSSDELLRAIPNSTMSIFRPGSVEPGAMLTDAFDALGERDPRCDAAMKELCERELLEEAVETCINAAKFERDTKQQMQLIRAAAYGSRFLEDDDQRDQLDSISEVCRDMRVINMLGGTATATSSGGGRSESFSDVGIPLTYAQYEALSFTAVIHRLALWSLHALAIRISDYLKIPGDGVAQHWACERIRNASASISDEDLFKEISRRFKGTEVPGSGNIDIVNKVIVSTSGKVKSAKSTRHAVASNLLGSVASNSAAILGASPPKVDNFTSSGFRGSSTSNLGHNSDNGPKVQMPNAMGSGITDQGPSLSSKQGLRTALAKFDGNGRNFRRDFKNSGFPNASLVPVAQQAYLCHRNGLVKALMSLETNIIKQVSALVKFDLLDQALQHAAESYDTELIFFTVSQAKSGLMLFQFFDLVARHSNVMRIMLKYWEESDQQGKISQFLQKSNVHSIAGRYLMQDAANIDASDFEQRDQVTAMSAQAFKKAGPQYNFFVEIAEERIALEREQRKLSHKLVGKSLRQTIFNAVHRREYDLAEALALKFKLRPRCYLLTKLKALVSIARYQFFHFCMASLFL